MSSFIITQDASISISYEAMNEIQKLSDAVSEEINNAARDLERFIQRYFIKDYKKAVK